MDSLLRDEGQVLLRQPPIVGDEDGSIFLTRDAYINVNSMGVFGSRMEESAGFLFDIQSASLDEQVILGSGVSDGTAFRIRLHAEGVPHRIELMVRDDDGKVLAGYADTSPSWAKRLVCTADPRSNLLAFFELQPWVNDDLKVQYTKQETPLRFSNLLHPFIMGGWNLDGQRQAYYVGRMANVAVFNRWFTKTALKPYKKASTNPTNLPLIGQVPLPTLEQLTRLDADIKRLERFTQKPFLEFDDFFDASIILYRWFLDTPHPMMKEVCEAYGIQLWFHGKSDVEANLSRVVLEDAPIYLQTAGVGSDNLFGFKWIPQDAFWREASFFVEGKAISHRYFIDLVRNKLGGGHFDKDRTQDQRKLLELTAQFRLADQNALSYQMHQLVKGVIEAIKTCGVQDAIQLNLRR